MLKEPKRIIAEEPSLPDRWLIGAQIIHEYRKRATDPENPVFSGFYLYSENLSDTIKTHENVTVTNR